MLTSRDDWLRAGVYQLTQLLLLVLFKLSAGRMPVLSGGKGSRVSAALQAETKHKKPRLLHTLYQDAVSGL